MQQYETGFILAPSLSDEDAQKFIQQMAEVVSLKKGKMVRQDVWGKRRLAYTIQKFQEGLYVFLTYEGGGDIPLELERRFKQTDAVIRFLTVKKDLRDQTRKKKKVAPEAPAPAGEAGPETAPPAGKEEK